MGIVIGIGIIVVAIILWVLLLRKAGTASGEAIANDLNIASEKIEATMGELIREIPRAEPERLSVDQFHHLVEKAADDFTKYIQVAHLVTSKLNQASGRATRPLADFLADATAEFAPAIGVSIESRDPSRLIAVMDKYGIKRSSGGT